MKKPWASLICQRIDVRYGLRVVLFTTIAISEFHIIFRRTWWCYLFSYRRHANMRIWILIWRWDCIFIWLINIFSNKRGFTGVQFVLQSSNILQMAAIFGIIVISIVVVHVFRVVIDVCAHVYVHVGKWVFAIFWIWPASCLERLFILALFCVWFIKYCVLLYFWFAVIPFSYVLLIFMLVYVLILWRFWQDWTILNTRFHGYFFTRVSPPMIILLKHLESIHNLSFSYLYFSMQFIL